MSRPDETLGGVGEFGLIDRILAGLKLPPQVRISPGDDAAVFSVVGDVVATTDAFVEGVHFRRSWSSPKALGRRVVAANVADVEAMGARPVALLLALCVPLDLDPDWVVDFAAGVRAECDTAGVALVGGDTTRSRDITATGTAIGQLEGRSPVTRAGARPGDSVALRGRTGWAATGLALLAAGVEVPLSLADAYAAPLVPYGAGASAATAGATSMIDVSDGLVADLKHVARASAVAIELDSSALAVPSEIRAAAEVVGLDPRQFLLTGGEDHALAATFPPEAVPTGWLPIGRVASGPAAVRVDGADWPGSGGWDHFLR